LAEHILTNAVNDESLREEMKSGNVDDYLFDKRENY